MKKYKAIISALLLTLSAHAETITVAGVTCDLQRDKHGKIARSRKVLSTFRKRVPCPATGQTGHRCEGYVIDHIQPLCGCGVDAFENLQWQTIADSKIKDRLERELCAGSIVLEK